MMRMLRLFHLSSISCFLVICLCLLFSPSPSIVLVSGQTQTQTTPPSSNTTVNVGVIYSASGSWASFGSISKYWAQTWADWVNTRGGIQPHGWKLQILYYDIQSNITLVPIAVKALDDLGAHVLIAPDSALVLPAAQTANSLGIPIVSYIFSTNNFRCTAPLPPECAKVGDRRFSYAFSAGVPAEGQFRDYYQLMSVRGAKSVGMIYFDDPFNAETCLAGNTYAQDNDIEVKVVRAINAASTQADIGAAVADIAKANPDFITICHRADCSSVINAMYEQNYMPKSAITLQCIDNAAQVTKLGGPNRLKHLMGVTMWDARLKGPDYQDGPIANMFARIPGNREYSPAILARHWRTARQSEPDFFPSLILAEYEMIWIALANSQTLSRDEIRLRLSQVDASSQFGRLSSGPFGMNQYKTVLMQQMDVNGVVQIVSPASTATADVVFPIPDWNERDYVAQWGVHSIEQAMLVLLFILLITSIVLIMILLISRKTQLQSLHKPSAISTIIGFMCLSASILTWMVDNASSACSLRIPLIAFGIIMILSSQLYRTYLVYSIFYNSKLQVLKMGFTPKLMVWTFAIIIPMMLAMIWSVAEPLVPTLMYTDPLRLRHAYQDCNSTSMVSGIVLISWVTGMILIWTIFIWLNRHVEETFSRTISLVLFIYMFIFSLIVIVIVQVSSNSSMDRKSLFALRSGSILFVCIMGLMFLYGFPIISSFGKSSRKYSLKVQPHGAGGSALSRGSNCGPSPAHASDKQSRGSNPNLCASDKQSRGSIGSNAAGNCGSDKQSATAILIPVKAYIHKHKSSCESQ